MLLARPTCSPVFGDPGSLLTSGGMDGVWRPWFAMSIQAPVRGVASFRVASCAVTLTCAYAFGRVAELSQRLPGEDGSWIVRSVGGLTDVLGGSGLTNDSLDESMQQQTGIGTAGEGVVVEQGADRFGEGERVAGDVVEGCG